jgi:succinate dehydrogenase / fumarate reductase cytochrome b subunit
MAETAQLNPAALTAGEVDRSFLWRRLHSLSGLIPVGAFLLFHTYENTGAIRGEEAYNEGIKHLSQMLAPPYFYLLELFGIMMPIAFHGLYGAYVALEGRPNVGNYGYRRNYLYLAQRVTGVIALVFIAYHILALRVGVTMLKTGQGLPGLPGYVTFRDVASHYANNWVLGWYAVGVVASAFHLGNGLNGFCWTWGIAVGEKSRKIVELLGWAVAIGLSIPLLHVLWAFRQG